MREKFSSRLGFILISAGCAIGLGNVWRFPYITGKYGGAAFVLIYLFFLLILGLPIMVMEYSVGRSSQKSAALAFDTLTPKKKGWRILRYIALAGNYLLMMFYTTICGWMIWYCIKMLKGDFVGASTQVISDSFSQMLANPVLMVVLCGVVTILGFLVCSRGLQNGLEKVSKYMMIVLLALMVVLVLRSVTLPGAMAGIEFYLKPDFSKINEYGMSEVVFAAMGQAFFTLSLGIGAMEIFGSFINKEHTLAGEAIRVVCLDTFVALMAGMIVIPACFAYNINPGEGPSLVFITLPNIFANMNLGNVWGALFFLFLSFAAFTTIIAVFQNIMTMTSEMFGWDIKKATWINGIAIFILSLPCALGFNILSFIQPLGEGSTIQDLEDFIVSNNLLPLGSLGYLLYCTSKYGWGFDKFLQEANTGQGIRFPKAVRAYVSFILPLIILYIFIQGYLA